MKYLALIILITLAGCGGNSNKTSGADTMNSIEDRPLQDTVVSPFPDGYAPPNTEIDTSDYRKDSINKRNSN